MKSNSVEKNIVNGTLIIIVISILAKFTSFISEAVLAAFLGTSYQSDAYYMVSSIQQVIYPMLSVGIWKVFLPIYKEKIAKDQFEEASSIANKVTTLFTVVSIIVCILIFVLSDNVVGIVAPGFVGETRELCSYLVKISSPMYIFIVAAAVYSSMLQCHNKFLGSQIREVASHIPTIIAAFLFYRIWGIKSLAIALVFGGVVRLLVELPFVDWGYRYKPDFHFKDSDLFIMFKRLPSALISEGVNQLNTLIDKMMASSLPTGAISSLNYGNRLMNVFSGLFSTAIATALYPQIVELVALNKKEQLGKLMSKIMNIFMLIMIPITLGCLLFSTQLITVVFKRGAFDAKSVQVTTGVFACYCIGLIFIAYNTILSNVFYGYGDTKTPMYISIINLIANVIGNIVFIKLWGVKGLALSTSTSAIIAFLFRLVFIKKYVNFDWKNIGTTFFKISLASIVACFIPKCLFLLIKVNMFIQLFASGIIAMILYVGFIWTFKIDELSFLISMINKKMRRN